jgi:hypothetical protein
MRQRCKRWRMSTQVARSSCSLIHS